MSRIKALTEHGQSIWLDYIRRGMTRSGELARLVEEDGVRGVTSNPSIFQKSIGGSTDYADALQKLLGDDALGVKDLYEALAIVDIQEACDALRPVYDRSEKADGFVSFEVAPGLAKNTEGTIAEARRLWSAVARPNLMIKVPGTPQGIVAIEQLITEGINVNVTLIFACAAYEDISNAYIRGISARHAAGKSVADVASVASFFVSRIDTEVDNRLGALAEGTPDPHVAVGAKALQGKIAIANAKRAYQIYEARVAKDDWKALAAAGARPQRLLWASTGTKNAAYPDTLYIDELVGPDTVNTVPPKTLDAFVDHGTAALTLTKDVDQAIATLAAMDKLGVSLTEVTDLLLERGLAAFSKSMDDLLATVAMARRASQGGDLNRTSYAFPAELQTAVDEATRAWDGDGKTARIWEKDATVWTGGDEGNWLGWLDTVGQQAADAPAVMLDFQAGLEADGLTHILLLGMGGSSLCPDVLSKTYGARCKGASGRTLGILDSTVPAQVARAHASIDVAKTLFIVASKSGSTLEPTAFMHSFLSRALTELGEEAAKHFVAITDPGSKLEAFAKENGFRHIFYGVPEIGGRFSALSAFGLVPAAAMGLDVSSVLGEAQKMVDACQTKATGDNPGARLGVALGAAARQGIDKLTVVASPAIASFGAWLEQLVAESTGKHGKAIIPVDGEPVATAASYGKDRLFVYLRLDSTPDLDQDAAIDALEAAGQPVIRIGFDDVDALPQELFRWQFATAVAGSVMELHPFDQPDVEASKVASRALTAAYEKSGSLPSTAPFFEQDGIALFADDANRKGLGEHDSLAGHLAAHLQRAGDGDYIGLLSYIDMNPANEAAIAGLRASLRRAKSNATCVGFGPRFLHSTGQAYKGGPNTGVFMQITSDDAKDLEIKGLGASFGIIKQAQSGGDLTVLQDRERRAIRVHLGADVASGLATLASALDEAMGGE